MKNKTLSVKKIVILALIILTAFTQIIFVGCKTDTSLTDNIIELRSNVFEGKSDNYTLSASYGFKKTNNTNSYLLTFKLHDKELESAEYILKFNYNDIEFKSNFTLNPLTNVKTVSFEIPDFNESEFTVTVLSGSNAEDVNLTSLLPTGTLTITQALNKLSQNQPALIDSYKVDGEFKASIIARVLVKNEQPYWFICFSASDEKKALLVDGITGEVLAIREIF